MIFSYIQGSYLCTRIKDSYMYCFKNLAPEFSFSVDLVYPYPRLWKFINDNPHYFSCPRFSLFFTLPGLMKASPTGVHPDSSTYSLCKTVRALKIGANPTNKLSICSIRLIDSVGTSLQQRIPSCAIHRNRSHLTFKSDMLPIERYSVTEIESIHFG